MRPNNFDLIRLLAALQVVYCHTTFHLKIDSGIGHPSISWFVNWFPGVPIFFTISGFLISRSWERTDDWRDYARKRVLRIYPALWVQLAVGVLLVTAFGAMTPSVVVSSSFWSWIVAQSTCVQFYNPQFLRGFGLGVLNGSLWTIPVELGFYVSLPILYRTVVDRVSRRSADVCLTIFSLLSFAYWFYLSTFPNPDSVWTKLQMASPLPHYYMFLLGVVLQRNFDRVLPLLESRCLLWLVAFGGWMLVFDPWGAGRMSSSLISVMVGRWLLAMTVLSFAFSWRSLGERLLRGNDISYGVYLYHGMAINVLVQIGSAGSQGHLAVVLLITVIFATLSWVLIEKPSITNKAVRSTTLQRKFVGENCGESQHDSTHECRAA